MGIFKTKKVFKNAAEIREQGCPFSIMFFLTFMTGCPLNVWNTVYTMQSRSNGAEDEKYTNLKMGITLDL